MARAFGTRCAARLAHALKNVPQFTPVQSNLTFAHTLPQMGLRAEAHGLRLRALGRGFASSATPDPTPSKNVFVGGPVGWKSLALLLVTGGGLVAYYESEKSRRKKVAVTGPSVGKAAIGGPFTLVDQAGRKFTENDLKGGFALLYFGFTHCPDICPDELIKIASVVDLVEKQTKKKVQPVFISIDPERDNVSQVKSYVKEFHPRMIGLTGSKEAVVAAAKAYRVYYTKADETEKDYLIDHSIISYLIDPNGDFVAFYGKNTEADDMAKMISEHVRSWSSQ